MTPLERWNAAVARQHEVAAMVDAAGNDPDSVERVCAAMNASEFELRRAYEQLPGMPDDGVWTRAYAILRDAHIRWGKRSRLEQAIRTVDEVSRDAREAGLRITAAIGGRS